MGGVGYPLMAVAQQATALDRNLRLAMILTQMLLSAVGMTGIGLFTRRVFRPATPGMSVAVAAIPAGYLACALAQVAGPGIGAVLDGKLGPWMLSTYIGIGTMLWAATESFSYFRMLKKRMALGLADAAVTDRFRLWAIAIYSASTISILGMVLQEIFGIAINGTTAGHLLVGPLGLVASSALWLAFLPPAAYLRRVQRRSERRSEAHASA